MVGKGQFLRQEETSIRGRKKPTQRSKQFTQFRGLIHAGQISLDKTCDNQDNNNGLFLCEKRS